MTTPDPAAEPAIAQAAASDADHRLHPMSWLFVLLAQLKQFVVPLVALVVFGRGDRNELWPLIGVGVLAAVSVWRYFTYRYGLLEGALVIRQGLLERSLRVIPFTRIHNVALQQSVLHRVFGVAEVRLESAGGKKPEAEMRVLKLEDALALEALVRRRGHAPAGHATDGETPGDTLLALDTGEVLRHGLVSNRGLIVVGAAAAGLSQTSPQLLPNLLEQAGRSVFGWVGDRDFDTAQYVLAAASLVALALVAVRVFSMALALLQYHGFTLSQHGQRLTIERGLLARWRTSASMRRIQAWTLHESLMHRLLRRRSLDVDTAVSEDQQQQRALRELAPIATREACDALIQHLLPGSDWPRMDWRAVAGSAWWRLFLPTLVLVALLSAALTWQFGALGLLPLLWLPWSLYQARQHARRMGYAIGPELVAVRKGWWSRHWRFAELDKLQALQVTRSPVDRWCGTATLWLDTAGASALSPSLRVRFLPGADAEALLDHLSGELARRPLRW